MGIKIDTKNHVLEIEENNRKKIYHYEDIAHSIYNLGIYYKNRKDKNGRRKALISNFAYWDLKFKNGDRYYLTNLLIDFLHKKAFLTPTVIRYRILPTVQKNYSPKSYSPQLSQKDTDKILEKVKHFEKNDIHYEIDYTISKENTLIETNNELVAFFASKYESKSVAELKNMLEHKHKYQLEAIEAIEKVLKKKTNNQ